MAAFHSIAAEIVVRAQTIFFSSYWFFHVCFDLIHVTS